MNAEEPWYDTAFRAAYLDVYAHRDAAAARREIDWVSAALDARGCRVLDAGCGAGRHARELARAGHAVVGLDRSAELLVAAVRDDGGPHYVRGDFRALPFATGAFRGLVSLFTAFGYFDDVDNARQIREFRRVVSRGGVLVLDYLNASRVRGTLVERSQRTLGDRTVIEERAIRAGRVEKDVTMIGPDGTRRWRESVRLYARSELDTLLRDAGFSVRSVSGDLEGAEHDADSPRLVFVAEAA